MENSKSTNSSSLMKLWTYASLDYKNDNTHNANVTSTTSSLIEEQRNERPELLCEYEKNKMKNKKNDEFINSKQLYSIPSFSSFISQNYNNTNSNNNIKIENKLTSQIDKIKNNNKNNNTEIQKAKRRAQIAKAARKHRLRQKNELETLRKKVNELKEQVDILQASSSFSLSSTATSTTAISSLNSSYSVPIQTGTTTTTTTTTTMPISLYESNNINNDNITEATWKEEAKQQAEIRSKVDKENEFLKITLLEQLKFTSKLKELFETQPLINTIPSFDNIFYNTSNNLKIPSSINYNSNNNKEHYLQHNIERNNNTNSIIQNSQCDNGLLAKYNISFSKS